MRYLLDPVWFYTLFGTYEDDPITFEAWQVAHLHDYSRVRSREKSPQIGFSWACAAEAVHESIMFEDVANGFISVDQREAQNKILYARKIYDGLPGFVQDWVPLVRDSMEALDFGSTARPAQLISLPATAGMRGRNMSVYLDESDFYKDGGLSAYRAAIGRISKGGGRVTIGSTCMGVDTLLDRHMQGNTEGILRVSTARFPWSVVENEEQLEIIMLAKDTLDPDDFAEEYECIRAGSSAAPFAPEMVRKATHGLSLGAEVDVDDSARIRRVKFADEKAVMVAGYDVGKGSGRHPSILSVFGQYGATWRQLITVSPQTRSGQALTLPEQEGWLTEMMNRCPGLVLVPDAQGVGAQIQQALSKRFGRRVIPMIAGSKPKGLKPQDKTEMITDMKRAMEAGEFELMEDKEQFQQFVRTKKESGNYTQRGSTKRSHFDRFWACAYAQYGIAAARGLVSPYANRGLTVLGMGA